MKMTSILGASLLATSLAFTSVACLAGEDADMDRSNPKAFVKDSVITTKIKTKLAAEHVGSLAKIHVDTDADGVVWLSGTARTQAEIDKAVSIAKSTEHVVTVKNKLTVKTDD